MLAIARHLSRIGHQITFHTAEAFRDKAESCGLRFAPFVGKANHDHRRPQNPEGVENLTVIERQLHHLKAIFADTIPDLYLGVQQILRETPVDLILVDTMYFGTFPLLLDPKVERPPVICCGVNPLLLSGDDDGAALPQHLSEAQALILKESRQIQTKFRPLHDAIDANICACGAPSLPYHFIDSMYRLPDVVLQLSAEAFEYPRTDMPESISFIGPLLPSPSAAFEEPDWWSELDDSRPVVLVTQGTLANHDFNELIQPALNGLAGEDILVVVAAGRNDTETIVAPANARVAAFIPFDRLLPKVDVMVTNGGYGAVNHALSLGVPLVTAGDTEDKEWVSARVGWSGVGINLKTRYPDPEKIRDAVRVILMDEEYRNEAQRLRAEFARYNALGKIAEVVQTTLDQNNLVTPIAS
jgi:MGT family glycosyltransferase